MYDAVISYSHEDRFWVRMFVDVLRRRRRKGVRERLRIFLDEDSIAPGANWPNEISGAIHDGAHLIPIFSKSYFESETAKWELLQKVLSDLSSRRRTVVPCLIEACDIPAAFRHIQYVDFTKGDARPAEHGYFENIDRIAEAVGAGDRTRARKDRPQENRAPRYYIYLSHAKVEMLLLTLDRVRSRFFADKADSLYNVPPYLAEPFDVHPTERRAGIERVLEDLYRNDLVGDIGSDKPFIEGTYELTWGSIDWGAISPTQQCALFIGDDTIPMLLLGGSVNHLMEHTHSVALPRGLLGHSASALPGLFAALSGERYRPHSPVEEYLLLASFCSDKVVRNKYGGNPEATVNLARQKLTFVARVLKRYSAPSDSDLLSRVERNPKGAWSRLAAEMLSVQRTDIIAGTPLFVALSDR